MGEGFLLAPLALFAAAMCLTPGPNTVMITASSANFGFRRAIPHMLGVTFGFAFLVIAVGLGLASLFRGEPRLHALLRYAGAAYLLYLAWRIARAAVVSGDGGRQRPSTFVEAALLQGVNPKGWATAAGAVATYTTARGDLLTETAVIAAILATACLASAAIWGAFGAVIGRFLRDPRLRTAFNWSMACLLALSLLPALL